MEELNLKQLVAGIRTLSEEKNLPEDTVIRAVEAAIAAAWRHDHDDFHGALVTATLNIDQGTAKVIAKYNVVENPELQGQISLEDAKRFDQGALIDSEISREFEATTFGRIAAQTAKQVLIQNIREAEREATAVAFADHVGQILTGTVSQIDPRITRIDLGRGEGMMPASEQVPGERLSIGSRVKVLLKKIEKDQRGTAVILSRADANFVRELFIAEVPEIESGTVEIKAIAREAGRRTKIAVTSSVPGIDPVGTFVGQRGVRVAAVMSEIGEDEKIDIVTWDPDDKNFIANALSPAEVLKIDITAEKPTLENSNNHPAPSDEPEQGSPSRETSTEPKAPEVASREDNSENSSREDFLGKATVTVAKNQQSIAIGKQGQNVRLASALTGYELDIQTE